MFECYLDGEYIRSFDNEDDAKEWCYLYDGDHEPSYEYVGQYSDDEQPVDDLEDIDF